MRGRLIIMLWALAALDLLSGCLLLVWPGAWQELVHPGAVGTTFYALQQAGMVWIARGLVTAWAARRRSAKLVFGVGLAWGLAVPGELLLAWRVGDTGPYALGVHLAIAAFSVLVAVLCTHPRAHGGQRH
jgi:hypothetical protein